MSGKAKKEELLEYIRLLHQRESEKDSKAGTTYWALVVGVIYVGWHVMEAMPKLAAIDNVLPTLAVAMIQIYTASLAFAILFQLSSGSEKKKIFDYRIRSVERLFSIHLWVLILSLAMPAFLVFTFEHFVPQESQSAELIRFNFYYSLCFSLIFVIAIAALVWTERKGKLGSPIGIVETHSSFEWIGQAAMGVPTLYAFFGNLYFAAAGAYSISGGGDVYIVAFDITHLYFGLVCILRKGVSNLYASKLLRLERDVVIHSLSEQEISRRLSDELIGNYVGDWMAGLIKSIRAKADAVIQHAESVDDVIAEIKTMDKGFQYEINGRVSAYIRKSESLIDSLFKEINPVADWLSSAALHSRINKDEFIRTLVGSSASELQELSRVVKSKVNIANSNLRELFKELPAVH